MIRLLFLVAIVLGTIYLIRWFLKTPAETVSANIRKSLWLLLGLGLIFLAVTGRLNIIFAFIGSAIPLIAKYLPYVLRFMGIVKTIQSVGGKNQVPTPPTTTKMSREEAFDILGLQKDASKDQIIDAHKRLVQKLHPDKGGSDHLAAQLNKAKDFLLKENGR